MESSHKTSQITGRLLLLSTLLILGGAFISQYTSRIVQKVTTRVDETVQLVIRTKPVMTVAYNPATLKTHLAVENIHCNPKKMDCNQPLPSKFFIPKNLNREVFWEQFKQRLTQWRFNPLLVIQTLWDYITALHEKRTNLSPAEFIVLSLELTKLEPSDFAVKLPAVSKKRSTRKEPVPAVVPEIADKAPLAIQNRPLILEIFNASGKKGIALELTQYLREQNEKGLLRVDVFNYENYPSIQEKSWLEDYSGRLADVKQLSHTLGINEEIRTGTTPNVMCDTRIIIGKDFDMPL